MGQKPHSMGQVVPPLVQQAAERLLEVHYKQVVVAHMHTLAEAGQVGGLHILREAIAEEAVPAQVAIAEAATS